MLSERDPDQPSYPEGHRRGREPEQYLAEAVFDRVLAGHEGDRRADGEKADGARSGAPGYAGRSRDECEGQNRDDRADREEEERGVRGLPGGTAEVVRIDPEFLAGEGVEGAGFRVDDLARHRTGGFGVDALGLVDEREFLLLSLRGELELGFLDVELVLGELSRALYREPLAERHRKGSREKARDAGEEYLPVSHARSRDALRIAAAALEERRLEESGEDEAWRMDQVRDEIDRMTDTNHDAR